MNKFSQEFNENLCKFLTDLYKFTKNNSVKKILDLFNNLHTYKTAKKFTEAIGKHSLCIEKKDETLFDNKFIILPGIDMHKLWPSLDNSQKNKIWLHLEILSISANMLIQEGSENLLTLTDTKSMSSITIQNKDLGTLTNTESLNNFNPYTGVGSDNNDFNTDDLFSGPNDLPTDKNTSEFSLSSLSLTNMIDINKFVDIKGLKEQLNKITDEDIDSAFAQLKEVTGDEYDPKTATVIADILKEIAGELKKVNTDKSLQVTDVISTFEGLFAKLAPRLQDDKFDMKNLWKIAQVLSEKYTPADGTDNNMKMLSSFMQQQFAMIDKIGANGKMEITDEQQEEYLNQCNDILKDLGMNNLDIKNIDPNTLMSTLSSCIGSGGDLNMAGIQGIMGNLNLSGIQSMMGNLLGGNQKCKKKSGNKKKR